MEATHSPSSTPDDIPALSQRTGAVISAIVALLRLIALGFFAFLQ